MRFAIPPLPWLMLVAVLACVGVAGIDVAKSADSDTETDASAQARWTERMTENAEQQLVDDSLPRHRRSYVVSLTCGFLPLTGQSSQAIAFAEKHVPVAQHDHMYSLIAAAQSEADDVQGALQTVQRINNPILLQRTLVLVVARQAQRGDIPEALALLKHIKEGRDRDRARQLIIDMYLKVDALEKAQKLAVEVMDVDIRDQIDAKLQRLRTNPKLSDVDYVPRMVAQAKQDRALFEMSQVEVEFLWHILRAEVAIHEQDVITFGHAINDAKNYTEQWSGAKRRNASIRIAELYDQQGDKSAAGQAYRAILESLSEQTDDTAIDFGRIFLMPTFFNAVAKHLPAEDLEKWIVKLALSPDSGDLIGGIVAAQYVAGETDWCERMYEHCQTPRQRFEVAVRVLDTYRSQLMSQNLSTH